MRARLAAWYAREGFAQFLLGNQWNDIDGIVAGGRLCLVWCWVLIAWAFIIVVLT